MPSKTWLTLHGLEVEQVVAINVESRSLVQKGTTMDRIYKLSETLKKLTRQTVVTSRKFSKSLRKFDAYFAHPLRVPDTYGQGIPMIEINKRYH